MAGERALRAHRPITAVVLALAFVLVGTAARAAAAPEDFGPLPVRTTHV